MTHILYYTTHIMHELLISFSFCGHSFNFRRGGNISCLCLKVYFKATASNHLSVKLYTHICHKYMNIFIHVKLICSIKWDELRLFDCLSLLGLYGHVFSALKAISLIKIWSLTLINL